MNLVRLGHLYSAPGAGLNNTPDGRCETALVCGVYGTQPGVDEVVNLRVFDFHATDRIELSIPVRPPSAESQSTFHLSGECPWKK